LNQVSQLIKRFDKSPIKVKDPQHPKRHSWKLHCNTCGAKQKYGGVRNGIEYYNYLKLIQRYKQDHEGHDYTILHDYHAAELAHVFKEKTTDTTNTSNLTWADIDTTNLRLPSTGFTANRKYLILVQAHIGGSSVSEDCQFRIEESGGIGAIDYTTHSMEPDETNTTDRYLYSCMFVYTAPTTVRDLDLQWQNVGASDTIRIDQAVMHQWEISEDLTENTDWHYNQNLTDTTLQNGTWSTTNNASITFTPNGTDRWLFMSNTRIRPDNSTRQVESRVTKDGTIVGKEWSQEGEDTTNDIQMHFHAFTDTPSNASHTYATSCQREAGGGQSGTRYDSNIFALNLEVFDVAQESYAAGAQSVTSSTWANVRTVTINPTATRDVFCLAFGMADADGSSWGHRLQVEQADQPPTQTSDAYGMTIEYDPDDFNAFSISTVENLTTGNKVIDYDARRFNTALDLFGRLVVAFTFELASAAFTATQTFTIDIVVQETQTQTFTIDVAVQETQTQTFTIDCVVEEQQTQTFTIDCVVQETQTQTFTIDCVVLETQTQTFTVDVHVVTIGTQTFTIDVAVQEVQTQTFTIDLVVLETQTQTFTIDTVVQETQTQTFTIDTVVQETQTQTFTIDAVVAETQTQTFTIDTVVQETQTQTFTIDLVTADQNTQTFTIDTVVLETQTQTFTIDIVVQETQTQTFTIDVVVLETQTQTFTIDVVVLETQTQTFTIDCVVQETQAQTFTIDTVVQETQTQTFTIDVAVQETQTQTFTIDLVTADATIESFTIDVVVLEVQTQTFTIDVVTADQNTQTFTIDLAVQETQTQTFTIDTVVLEVQTQTFTIDLVVQEVQTQTFTIDLAVEEVPLQTFTIDTVVLETQTQTFTIDTVVLETQTQTFTIDLVVQETQTQTLTIDVVVQEVQTQTFTIDLVVLETQTQTFTIDTVVSVLQTQTFTIDCVVAEVQTQTLTIDLVILETQTQTFTIDLVTSNPFETQTFTIDLVTGLPPPPILEPGGVGPQGFTSQIITERQSTKFNLKLSIHNLIYSEEEKAKFRLQFRIVKSDSSFTSVQTKISTS